MIALRAPAKLTWFLEVTGRREDGYHWLRSEMLTIDLSDLLVIDENEEYLRVFNPYKELVPENETNLAARALALVDRRAGVTIEKAIPVGGGLGGGSADAGAVLRWAGGVSAEAALTLGGDVPFCQLGGRAIVEGVGELLTPLEYEKRLFTLIMPDFGVSTGDCYRAYDELTDSGWKATGANHLEEAARVVEPRLARSMDWLRAELGQEVHLAGSGSTMFVEGAVGPAHSQMTGPEGTLQLLQSVTTPAEGRS
ncbi:MAG: 4-(cytidine 5'-diphospho)-2-C-methyl-D-erythritol kinase [Acidimicrobiales bacterium]|jgi:4-diphosphocytidyl-2-C-methyl-D-erythritol kinase